MIHNFANSWADRLVSNGADPENKEVIAYGIEVAINEVIANIIAFTIAFLLKMPLEMLIWQVFWIPLRVNIGGHHANSHLSCLIYSTALATGCMLILPYIIDWIWLLPIEIAVTLIVVFFFAPSIHPNHLVSEQHVQKIKKWGKRIALVETALIILFYSAFPLWVSQIAGLGMFAATILCILGKIFHRKKSDN